MCERNISGLSLARPLLRTWPATQAHALTGNQTSDPLVHRLALSPLSHISQGMNAPHLKEILRFHLQMPKRGSEASHLQITSNPKKVFCQQ